jgi:ABC-type oligopeptide transport system substrate-binding subunit
LVRVNWLVDYASADAVYSVLLLPDAASKDGRWDDEQFVEVLEAASAAESEPDQARAYRAVDARVDEKAPVIPWAYGSGWWLVRPGLRGLGNLTLGLIDLGRVSWDE